MLIMVMIYITYIYILYSVYSIYSSSNNKNNTSTHTTYLVLTLQSVLSLVPKAYYALLTHYWDWPRIPLRWVALLAAMHPRNRHCQSGRARCHYNIPIYIYLYIISNTYYTYIIYWIIHIIIYSIVTISSKNKYIY